MVSCLTDVTGITASTNKLINNKGFQKLCNCIFQVTHISNFTDTETVHNLSNLTITAEELELLKYGLKDPIHPLQVNKTDILMFDFIHRTMTKDLRDEKQSGEVKTNISNLAHSYVNSYKQTLHALQKHQILKRLSNNKDIVILHPD